MKTWPNVRLTPLSKSDASQMNVWQNNPEIHELLMGFRGPVSPETTEEWIKSLRDQNLKNRVVFGIRHGGRLVGMINLFDLDWLHRSAKLGIFVGDSDARGHGVAQAACSLLLDYAFSSLGLKRVMLEVLTENNRAIELYKRLGFALEGVLRKAYFCRGKRSDVAVYAILEDEWNWDAPPEAARLVGHEPLR